MLATETLSTGNKTLEGMPAILGLGMRLAEWDMANELKY